MKNIYHILLCTLIGFQALANCQKLKLNGADEILFVKNCNNICVLKVLSHEAREYILVSDLKESRIKSQVFYLDQTNTVQNSYTDGSDFFKIYSSSPLRPYVADIIKYDKSSKVLEIIEINAQKIQAERHAIFTCSK